MSEETTELKRNSAAERRRYREERLLFQLRELIDANWDVDSICEHFKMSRHSYHKWMKRLAAQDKKHLDTEYQSLMFTEIMACAKDFGKIIEVMRKMVNDESLSVDERVSASKMLCEVRLAKTQLYKEGPSAAIQSLPLVIRKDLSTYNELPKPPYAEDPIVITYSSDGTDNQQTTDDSTAGVQ